jgi:hypothetical protein
VIELKTNKNDKKVCSLWIPRDILKNIKSEAKKENLSLSDFLIFKATGLRPKEKEVEKTYKNIVKGKEYFRKAIIKEVSYE